MMEWCKPCDKSFETLAFLTQHLRSKKHSQTYCTRCEKEFPDARARQQHITDSSRHHLCYNCNHRPDFDDEDELNEHLETEHHICVPCDRTFNNASDLTQHDVAVHYKCKSCGTYQESQSNLKNVSILFLSRLVDLLSV
jgi:hypothetical protein